MFTLIDLPYAPSALEPVISARTLEFHHGKHLQGYVNNLNALLPGSPFEGLPLEEIVRQANPAGGSHPNGAVFNNAGQILNHNLYFTQFKEILRCAQDDRKGAQDDRKGAQDDNLPIGKLAAQINKQWGSVEAFQAEFVAKGAGLFGSGWVWLSASPATEGNPHGELVITQEPGASNPIVKGLRPLLTFDVWEHAYYLDYQNRRPDHLKALWGIVNWEEIERRYVE